MDAGPEGPEAARSVLDVVDWRRRTAASYARVRALAVDDPAVAHTAWVRDRDELFAEHPASPLSDAAKESFTGLDVAAYDPAYRFEVETRPAAAVRLDVPTGTDGIVAFECVGIVELDGLGRLGLWALRSYGGGLFVPVKDASAGRTGGTYGGGRYLLDTIKGADLGERPDGRLVVDLNFAYNPSCAYDAAWACPLAPADNVLGEPLPVGERVPAEALVTEL